MTIFSGPNGELMFDAVPMKETEHLAALIAKQKSAPKRMRCPLVRLKFLFNHLRLIINKNYLHKLFYQ